MNGRRAKEIRKAIGYDIKKERADGRELFSVTSKTEVDANGNPKYMGIICGEKRRLYKLLKKYNNKRNVKA